MTVLDPREFKAFFGGAAAALALILPPAAAWAWFSVSPEAMAGRIGLSLAGGVSPILYGLAGIASLLPVVLMSAALLSARRWFQLLGRDIALTAANVVALRDFGRFVTWSSVAGLVAPSVIGALLSAGAGEARLIVSIGSTPALGLIFGGVIWAMASVTDEASAIADDHAQII